MSTLHEQSTIDVATEVSCKHIGEKLKSFGDKIERDYQRRREFVARVGRILHPYFETENLKAIAAGCFLVTHCTLMAYATIKILRSVMKVE